MERNNSLGVISSLQMDYGDSDEEDSLSKSRNNSIDGRDETKDSDTKPDLSAIKPDVKPAEIKPNIKVEVTEEKEANLLKSTYSSDEKSPESEKPGNFLSSLTVNSAPKVEEEAPPQVKVETAPKIEAVEAMDVKEEVKEETQESPDQDFISDDEDHGGGSRGGRTRQPSPPTQPPQPQPPRKATRLVSYGPDEDVSEDDSASEASSGEMDMQESPPASPPLADPAALSRSVQNMEGHQITIPPEPQGQCSARLQEKIAQMYELTRRGGRDLNRDIQSKKSFRNPSIYEKLIDYCNIDQQGTNFPPEIYDPHLWGKESFYDELDKAQRKDMEKREKEKKDRTKIEFVTGTKKSSSSDGHQDEKKRKTKWDAQPGARAAAAAAVSGGPGVVNLTHTATGTKATVISALGSLAKPRGGGK